MKMLLALILLPLLSFGQSSNHSQSYELQDSIKSGLLYVKNSAVVFQKVYSSNLGREQLLKELKSFLPSVKAFDFKDSFGQSNEQLNGKLTNFYVNNRRYKNGSLFDFSSSLDAPLNADVTIQIKDYKYRVTISGIHFFGDSSKTTLENEVLKTLTPKFKDIESGTKFLSQDFDWEFDITRNNMLSSDF